MIKESKYCSDLMKEHLKKELVINKKDKKDFENYTKCSISDNVYVDGDVKVRDHGKIKSLFMIYVHFLLYWKKGMGSRLVLKLCFFFVSWCVWKIQKYLKSYGLCLSHFFSAPALNWDAILNMTKV